MKLAFVAFAATVLLAGPALASKDLAQKHACLACHAVDKKIVGPSYQEVANKYKGQKDAAAVLTASIKNGGAGKWGPMAMPPQATLSDVDAKALATWILSTAK